MPEDVVTRLDGPGKRQHDAPFVRLGDAAGALAEFALDRVGLAEVRAARIENEGLTRGELVVQQL